MSKKEIIEKKLSVLNPQILRVIDNSTAHAGHAGNPNNDGETHFEIQISSTQLDNLTKIKQHRLINNALKDEFASGLHALSIKIIAKI